VQGYLINAFGVRFDHLVYAPHLRLKDVSIDCKAMRHRVLEGWKLSSIAKKWNETICIVVV
jgi:hypothetical protein